MRASHVVVGARADALLVREIAEPTDGRYYVTHTGRTLHLSRDCGRLWSSCREVCDSTKTLAYRVLTRRREAGVKNGRGDTVWRVCELCGPRMKVTYPSTTTHPTTPPHPH